MSDSQILLRRDILDRNRGQHNVALEHRYIPNADPKEDDPHAEWDMMVAKAITRVLLGEYRGHFWEVTVSRKQGIATITIPILLGNWKYALRLCEDIQPRDIIRAGGEILERFKIPRTNMDLPAFLNARRHAVSHVNERPPE